MRQKVQKMIWFGCGLFAGLTILSITKASVPLMSGPGVSKNAVTDDTALYQRLSEIHIKKELKLNFDSDIQQLARLEGRYQEKLPSLAQHPRLKSAMQRISQSKYHYSGKPSGSAVARTP